MKGKLLGYQSYQFATDNKYKTLSNNFYQLHDLEPLLKFETVNIQ